MKLIIKIMKIEEKIYQQYRDTPYKYQEFSKNQQIAEQNEENKEKSKKPDAYSEFLTKIKESINEPKGRRISDNITLRVSIDKTRQNNYQESSLIGTNNNSLDIDNKEQYKYSLANKDKRKNITFINNLYKEEIKHENNNLNFDKNQIANSDYDNKVFLNNNNFGGSNYNKNNNNFLEYEKNNKFSYNPFIQKNVGNGKNNQINDLNNQNNINFEQTNIQTSEQKFKNNQLKTIDQKLREEPIDKNIINNINDQYFIGEDINNPKKSGNEINNDKGKNNILITNLDPLDDNFMNYNFVLSLIQEKGKKTDEKDIDKLKKDLNVIPAEKKTFNEDNLNNQNSQNQNIQNNAEFIERQNIYGNSVEKVDDKNKKFFYLKAEPIENNIQNNINFNEENNLGTSSEIIDFDKNSEYTIKTGTNIDQIVRKNSKLCPKLLAILFGSAGLLFLLYSSKAIRNILLNLLKIIPDFFRGLFTSFGEGIVDFLEKYNDSYRFLGDLFMIIIFWIILRFFIKCIAKYIKKENK